jgi:hypothetical protein
LLQKLLTQAKAPLKDAAAVNVTRWALYWRVQALGLPVECGSGGLTKYNRMQRDLPKAHWCDAACVGKSTPFILKVQGVIPLLIAAQGHGSRQMCNVDRYGFPKGKPKQGGRVKGFRTGANQQWVFCSRMCSKVFILSLFFLLDTRWRNMGA